MCRYWVMGADLIVPVATFETGSMAIGFCEIMRPITSRVMDSYTGETIYRV